jgi:hypothetical protein
MMFYVWLAITFIAGLIAGLFTMYKFANHITPSSCPTCKSININPYLFCDDCGWDEIILDGNE